MIENLERLQRFDFALSFFGTRGRFQDLKGDREVRPAALFPDRLPDDAKRAVAQLPCELVFNGRLTFVLAHDDSALAPGHRVVSRSGHRWPLSSMSFAARRNVYRDLH